MIRPQLESPTDSLSADQALGERYGYGGQSDGGFAAAERALELDPNLADAHAVKARVLFEDGHPDEAASEIALALRLDPEAWEVNVQAALISFRQHRLEDAARYWEKAAALAENDFNSPGMMVSCYSALGNAEALGRAARITVARAERVIMQDRSNGSALSFGVLGHAVRGEAERAKEWIARALLVDPDNLNMRYNFACALATYLKDSDVALDMLRTVLDKTAQGLLNHAKADPDLDLIREDPRFKAMVEAAEARLAAVKPADRAGA